MIDTKLLDISELALKYGISKYFKDAEYDTDTLDDFPLNTTRMNIIEYFKYKGLDTEKEIEVYDILQRLCCNTERNYKRQD